MFLRKDATKHLVIRVDVLIRKTTIYAKIAFINENNNENSKHCQQGDYKRLRNLSIELRNFLDLRCKPEYSS
jgi:hypothetical protein